MKVRNINNCHFWHLLLIPFSRNTSIKFLFTIIALSFVLSLVWIYTVTKSIKIERFRREKLAIEALDNVARDVRYISIYRRRSHQKPLKNLKYILLWTPETIRPFSYLGKGQLAFIQNNCSMTNCFVTTDRSFFGGDVTKFHAVAFNGRNLQSMTHSLLPENRSIHQKYIFFNMESADNYPICNKIFDDFFNWTATYKLNSDIPFSYIRIRNKNGDIIGPRQNMSWDNEVLESEEDPFKLQNRRKAAAWFVSSCQPRSDRQQFVKNLQRALIPYGYDVDIYGNCGILKCPKDLMSNCYSLLKKDYYFYLSLENSFNEDYVTEKVLTAVWNNVVPIVYGGADYSRFLPPGSYLDGRRLSVYDLATTMVQLINSPKMYQEYFKRIRHYIYTEPTDTENVCGVCEALNNDTLRQATNTYKEFRKWWDPNYLKRCI